MVNSPYPEIGKLDPHREEYELSGTPEVDQEVARRGLSIVSDYLDRRSERYPEGIDYLVAAPGIAGESTVEYIAEGTDIGKEDLIEFLREDSKAKLVENNTRVEHVFEGEDAHEIYSMLGFDGKNRDVRCAIVGKLEPGPENSPDDFIEGQARFVVEYQDGGLGLEWYNGKVLHTIAEREDGKEKVVDTDLTREFGSTDPRITQGQDYGENWWRLGVRDESGASGWENKSGADMLVRLLDF